MKRWPEVDRTLRRALLDELRRRQNREARHLSATERVLRLDALLELARAVASKGPPGSDESLQLMARLKERFKALDARR